MRASPAFQITVRHFGVWRGALLLLLAMAAAVLVVWLVSSESMASLVLRGSVATVGAGLLVMTASLLRRPPFSLRWDGQQWHLGPASSVGEEPCQGRLLVALDVGAWMLLKFESASRSRWRRNHWLALQRRGLETHWHALRCAVYGARSKPVGNADSLVANAQELKE